jgi:hypothetical protein
MTEGAQTAQAYRRGVVLGKFLCGRHLAAFAGGIFVG